MGLSFKKVFADQLDHCYAVMHLKDGIHDYLVVASEEKQPCYAYDINNDFNKIEVWPDVGGTMSLVQIPGTMNFLASQQFYPGFNSPHCRIVKETFNGVDWDQTVIGSFPYVHRFDIIPHDNGLWFVGCSIANSKENVDDWSDPGKIFVGDYDDTEETVKNLRSLDFRLTKNHGYKNMGDYSLITGQEGIYKLNYPNAQSDWNIEQISTTETSDIVMADVNNDGENEYLTIEGFHGPYIRILDSKLNTLYKSEGTSPFGHAIWGGSLLGKTCFVFGFRSGKQDLEVIFFDKNKFQTQLIDSSVGPSNVLVYSKNNKQYILSANRESNEVSVYEVSTPNQLKG